MLMTSLDFLFTRFLFQRLLAFIYFIAFLIVVNQYKALCGERGLLPVRLFVKRIGFWDSPSLFWFHSSDVALVIAGWLGLGLSLLALFGWSERGSAWASAAIWLALWVLYLSFVNVGQTFYGFGWESLLLETGFLAIFLGPMNAAPSVIVIWLLRWILFRVMFGAGLIKMRGDQCWKDLTCLQYHYETQPLPGPLSWHFHQLSAKVQQASVLFNHFVELIVPFGYFGPQPVRVTAAILTILFQATLIASGNLSWLNCITIVLCFACFDDRFFQSVLGGLPTWSTTVTQTGVPAPVIYGLASLIGLLSIQPTLNLFANRQIMNTSFDPFRLVNTYGAFGSVTRERTELIIEGSSEEGPEDLVLWKPYEFKGKPGDLNKRPPQVTPYHYKLDWQMWFAAMGSYQHNPWLINLVSKLLQNDQQVLGLMGPNPFADRAPAQIRVRLFIYRFTGPVKGEKNWWRRQEVGSYLPPLSMKNPQFRQLLEEQGWL